MIVGIDASNIRGGGGVTHLIEILKAVDPSVHVITRVVVWGGAKTLSRLDERPWLDKRTDAALDGGLMDRSRWQRGNLSELAREARCNVLFVPGGSYAGNFHPIVTMSRNMLPFEWRELRRFGFSSMTVKLLALRVVQSRSFRNADGLIFLTRYARDSITSQVRGLRGAVTTIPHGVDARFRIPPREQKDISQYSTSRPFRILYVSNIDWYKHQWKVAEAVAKLHSEGVPVMMELVGPSYPPASRRLDRTLAKFDPAGECVRYLGAIPYEELHRRYAESDLCLFASSIENMPNILLEGMASGLPIACSNRGPMPEVLGDAGAYFDPEKPDEITDTLREMIDAPSLRARLAAASFERSAAYSWNRCASETFAFLARVGAAAEAQS